MLKGRALNNAQELDQESQVTLEKRAYLGGSCIALAYDGPWTALNDVEDDDRETAATDAISDILTALFGAAGTWKKTGGEVELDRFAENEARRVIEQAFDSWLGDAEDYLREPQPGEYGYEGDN